MSIFYNKLGIGIEFEGSKEDLEMVNFLYYKEIDSISYKSNYLDKKLIFYKADENELVCFNFDVDESFTAKEFLLVIRGLYDANINY